MEQPPNTCTTTQEVGDPATLIETTVHVQTLIYVPLT